MTLSEFSGGYYRTRMQVQPYEDGPVIESDLYDFIDQSVYARTNAPITLRVGLDSSPYFSVESENAVPTDVLAIPQSWIDDMRLHDEYGKENIFVLKPAYSYFVNQSIAIGERFDNHNVNDE